MPLVQDIFVQGKTVPEATRILSKAYSSYLAKPRISIGVAKFRPLRVTVMGQVDHPGTFAFEESPTISEAIANAGGLTKRARRNEIKIVEPDGSSRNCDLDQLLSGKEERLQEGTVIEVKEIWGPDLDQTILLISTMIGAAVVLIRR
ncbi:MAG TPA: hypothetical protein DD435_15010 [Cyanobacteria bacterium UBA8530]|nr:hypothetical protein [Cyanobacteria bacterium UBA8530]